MLFSYLNIYLRIFNYLVKKGIARAIPLNNNLDKEIIF